MSENFYKQLLPDADHHVADLTRLTADERLAVAGLFHEATTVAGHEQRCQQRSEFGQYAAEIAVSDRIQRQAELDLQSAREYTIHTRDIAELAPPTVIDLDAGKIGWLSSDDSLEVTVAPENLGEDAFWFGSITDEHRVTAGAVEHLESEGIADDLIKTLVDSAIPKFLKQIKSNSGNLRPVNRAGVTGKKQRNVNTTYPAYKLELHGSKNRVVVLLPEKIGAEQVVILAAIYDHEDQDKVLHILSA